MGTLVYTFANLGRVWFWPPSPLVWRGLAAVQSDLCLDIATKLPHTYDCQSGFVPGSVIMVVRNVFMDGVWHESEAVSSVICIIKWRSCIVWFQRVLASDTLCPQCTGNRILVGTAALPVTGGCVQRGWI